MQWIALSDLQRRCVQVEEFLERVPGCTETNFIAEACGEAASYLQKYREFFDSWETPGCLPELAGHVAAIAVYRITAASGTIAAQDLEDSVWGVGYKRAVEWLRDLQRGSADLNVDWPQVAFEATGHRAAMSIRTQPARF